ncbi:acetyl-CoA carboxylase family protein [Polymorphobacter arshaanensis]|nr:carboxyl transferase domain-containing protein [Polymorphobacter arshaanensis]
MFKRLFIANRGEIAVRIARAAAGLGIASVAAFSEDDAASPHVLAATSGGALPVRGPRAYLDGAAVIAAAKAAGCDALHPGYGFLSENAAFAADCAAAGITFVGPAPAALTLFGDKAAARAAAEAANVPVLGGTGAVSLEEAEKAFAKLGAVMIKALAGGGGRGMRIVTRAADLPEAYARASSEAQAAFGDGRVYLEAYMSRARHIEVQLIGDRHGGLTHAGTRECSLQRRHQKLIEIAPAHLPAGTETALLDAALRLGRAAHYDSLGTVEFLLDADDAEIFAFIEMNPRLQVEHTVTEEVTDIDLVATQIRIAAGAKLGDLALPSGHRGVAVQARVNAESVSADGALRASHAAITRYEAPSGPGIRVDGFARTGTQPNPAFDSLLAKVIARGSDLRGALALLDRALGECVIDGPATNTGFLRALIAHPDVVGDRMTTSLVDAVTADLVATLPVSEAAVAQVVPEGLVGIPAPLSGLVVAVSVAVGDAVRVGQQVAVLEAMKMEHVVTAQLSGIVRRIDAQVGAVANDGGALVLVEPAEVEGGSAIVAEAPDPDHIRPDLADLLARTAATLDPQRPDAVARRRKTGQRTARENIAELIDPGSFNEYGALTFAAQLKRHPREHLLKISPADGLIAGTASVNGDVFGPEKSRVMVLSYDYTVFAGTQGTANHKKTDRMLNLARDWALPLVWYAEGGGGRPGDTDHFSATGLDVPSFRALAALSGTCLRIGIASGRCFAGNAVMFGLCDITIATRDSTIGLGGPAMIEGGGLGNFKPEEVGPIGVMASNGVVDIVADDEPHATALTKQLLSYFQGDLPVTEAADQRLLRHSIPENRLRVYDVRSVIETLFDSGSVLELRRGWGIGVLTGFARLNGRAVGYLANDPKHLGGAIDSDGAAKAAHFMMLCDAFGIPIISLCDTPGFMVGPPSEVTGAVRHGSRMFTVGASLSVPVLMVVLRKAYGLGAQAMGAGSLHAPALTIAWPTAEFGGMGLEGAVRLGYAKELAACETEETRKALFDELVAKSYARGKAVSIAAYLEIDAVIDPADTRDWMTRALAALPRVAPTGRMVDNW